MRTALYRFYTKADGHKVKALQGKVFAPNGKLIFYRDLHEHKGRLWLEEGAWNLDYRTFLWLEKNAVKEIHYYWKKTKRLYIVTPRKIRKWLNEERLKVKSMGGHRQIFLPKLMFGEHWRVYPVPWIQKETDINKFQIPDTDVETVLKARKRLAKEWRKYA